MIEDQNKIIKNQKQHLDFINNLVEGLKKMYIEREEKIKELAGFEKEELKKDYETKLKKKRAKLEDVKENLVKAINYLTEFSSLIFYVSYYTGAPDTIKKQINNMKEEFVKQQALEQYNKAKTEYQKWVDDYLKKDQNLMNQILRNVWVHTETQTGDIIVGWDKENDKAE